ncbi:hypothetical protein ACLKA6_010958 [Drosophila palustris]
MAAKTKGNYRQGCHDAITIILHHGWHCCVTSSDKFPKFNCSSFQSHGHGAVAKGEGELTAVVVVVVAQPQTKPLITFGAGFRLMRDETRRDEP